MRLHLPSRLRKAVLACLASLLSVVNTSAWSASLLPVGALCLFAAAPNASAADFEQVTIGEGEYTVYGGAIGSHPYTSVVSNITFDAGGTEEHEKNITLTLQSDFTPKSVTIESGTHLTVQARTGQDHVFTAADGILNLFGTIEFVATSTDEAPGIDLSTWGSFKEINTFDESTGTDYTDRAKVILNFTGRTNYMNGVALNRLLEIDQSGATRYSYAGRLELQGICFSIDGEEAGDDLGTQTASGGEIIVDGGAQFQLGTINAAPNDSVTTDPQTSMTVSPRIYNGNVTLNGSSSGIGPFQPLTPGWVLKCGTLRMVNGSKITGNLTLTNNSNIVVFATTYVDANNLTFDVSGVYAEIGGSIIAEGYDLTVTGGGRLRVGGGRVRQMTFEDVAGSGVVVTQDANNGKRYLNRATTARMGKMEITDRATRENPLTVDGYATVRHGSVTASITGQGWTTICGSGTYVYRGSFGDGNLNVVVHGESDSLLQRIAYLSLDVNTLLIERGTLDIQELESGSGDTRWADQPHFVRHLEMSDRSESGEKFVSELRVNSGQTFYIRDTLKMTGGRIVVKGQVNSGSTPEVTRINEARLVLGYDRYVPVMPPTACDASGSEMNGVIELDAYSVLSVYGEDPTKRPINGLNISVVHDSAIAQSAGGSVSSFLLFEKDRLNLNNTAADFSVRMRDGGVLSNAANFGALITIQYTGGTTEDETPVTFQMGRFGLNGSIILDNEYPLVQGGNYGVLKDLWNLEIRNKAELDFSGIDMTPNSEALFNFTSDSGGELGFGSVGENEEQGSLTLTGMESGGHYHISNKKIAEWRQKVGMSYYDAILRGLGFSFDEFDEEGRYGDGWITVTGEATPSSIYVSTRDNNDGDRWGWNADGNPYESTSGARAVCVDSETRIDLSTVDREADFTYGLILPNLVGKSEGNLVITGNGLFDPVKRSLVSFSNRIDNEERQVVARQTGVTVTPDFYYNGSIDITKSDLAIRHVQKIEQEEQTDLAPPQYNSATIVTGTLNLSDGELWMQSGALEIRGGRAVLSRGVTPGGILFATENTAQMRISEGGEVTVDGAIRLDSWWDNKTFEERYTDKDPHILMSWGGSADKAAKLNLLDGATLEDGVRIGNPNGPEETEKSRGQTPGTVNINGTVTAFKGARLSNVALHLRDRSMLVDQGSDTATEWKLSGLSGSGRLESKRDLTFDLAGGDHTFAGDLVGYSGTMILRESGEYTQIFNDVGGNTGWNVEVQNGARVKFNISDKSYESNKLQMGKVTLEKGSRSSFLLNLASENLKPGGNGTAEEGFFFEELNVNAENSSARDGDSAGSAAETVNLEVGQESGAVVLANEDNKVRQYIGHATNYEREGGGDASLGNLEGVTLKNVLNVKMGTGRITIDASGDIYIEGELDAENKYLAETDSVNSRAGANFFNSIYSSSSALLLDGDLGYVVQALNDMLKVNEAEPTGKDTAGSNKLLASLAGSSTSVLAPALGADMQRNLRSIRNRTTSMGMDDGYEYENLSHTSFWVNAETSYLTRDDDGLLSGYKSNAYGGTLGVAHNISTRSTIGLALSAMYQNVTSDNADHMDADFTTAYLNLFAVTQRRSWRHTFIASVGLTNAKMDRRVSWTNGNEMGSYSSSGSTNGTSFGAMYELGYAFAMNEDQTTVLQPVFNLQWHNASLSEYDEEGGSTAALRVDPGSYSVVEVGLGTRLQMVVGESVYNRASLLEMRALLKFYAGDSKGESSVALLSNAGGSKSTVESASEGRVGIEVGAGLGIPLGNNAEFFFDAGAEVRSSFFDFNATAGLKFNF